MAGHLFGRLESSVGHWTLHECVFPEHHNRDNATIRCHRNRAVDGQNAHKTPPRPCPGVALIPCCGVTFAAGMVTTADSAIGKHGLARRLRAGRGVPAAGPFL
jgi:hypothetical protein